VLILTRSEVEAALDPTALLDAVSSGFQALSAGAVDAPPRSAVAGDDGSVLVMAGRAAGAPVAVKLVGVFPGNAAIGLDVHLATVVLLDASTGRALALMDGEAITALRTAAGSALATRACAREDASVLAIVGSGVQARAHLEMLPLVRSFRASTVEPTIPRVNRCGSLLLRCLQRRESILSRRKAPSAECC